jgi:hypothetical protein
LKVILTSGDCEVNITLIRHFTRVYAASRRQETSTLRNVVRLLGWALVGGLTWWQGDLNAEQVAAVIMVTESLAAAMGAFLPDQIKKGEADVLPPIELQATAESPAGFRRYRDTDDDPRVRERPVAMPSERQTASAVDEPERNSGFNNY